MYNFEARVPLDYGLQLARNIRGGEGSFADNQILVACILGEFGALLKSGFQLPIQDASSDITLEECCDQLVAAAAPQGDATAPQDLTPALLLIIKLVEMWLTRRS